jgi:hypothetical protein
MRSLHSQFPHHDETEDVHFGASSSIKDSEGLSSSFDRQGA